MNIPDFTGAAWHKSTFSGDNGGQCVEVAFHQGAVGVRDSKAESRGPVLAFAPQEWHAFVEGVIAGEF
ncbi:DUF397 domain-containing protein [Kitasatospora sp. NPDC052868]|uniref:DUF397 domain-containing protein n=1 Tax=Kitasatospora sp. NPDC052868 TaxID=3364060 RepID=UPI0037C505E5